MLQEATECRLPPAGDPTECVPAGAGRFRRLLGSRTGSPSQQLGGRAANEEGTRYRKRKLKSKGGSAAAAHDFGSSVISLPWFFMFFWFRCFSSHVIHFCFCSKVHEHCHRVRMHSCQHSVSHQRKWMESDQVSVRTPQLTHVKYKIS